MQRPALIIAFFSWFFAPAAQSNTVTRLFPTTDIKILQVSYSSGDLNITGNAAAVAKVTVEKRRWSKNCQLITKADNNTLIVQVSKTENASFFATKDPCEARTSITLPKHMEIKVNSGSGDLNLSQLTGKISVAVGSGDIKITEVSPAQLRTQSGSGDQKIAGEFSQVDLKTGSGDIKLTYLKSPIKGQTKIETGSGDAKVFLPQETSINLKFSAGHGRLLSEMTHDPKALFTLSMISGNGDLQVKKL